MALIARWRQLRVERKPGVTFQKCSSCAFCLADKRCNPPPHPHAPFGPSASIASAVVLPYFSFSSAPFVALVLVLVFFSFAQILRVFRNFNSWCLRGIYWYRPLAGGYSTVRPATPPFTPPPSLSIYLNQSPLLIPWPMPCLNKLLIYIGQYYMLWSCFWTRVKLTLTWPPEEEEIFKNKQLPFLY